MEAPVADSRRPKRKNYRWQFRREDPERARELERMLGIGPVVARVLANRGVEGGLDELTPYIKPVLSQLLDPFAMSDMRRATERAAEAIASGQKVTVYGDYDTDGVTSTSILLRTFEYLGHPASYYIPHRVAEGYGLNCAAIDQLADSGTQLIVTVDNGISALDQVRHAQARGVDVIVTDHHQVCEALPDCVAVVNPNRQDCAYENKYLTGAGVAFKFAHALLKTLNIPASKATPFLRSLMDLVAVGTVADLAPLVGENRVLVKFGMEELARTQNPGLVALKNALQIDAGNVNTYKIGFLIAPRLNAAGRTDSADICVELLTTHDPQRASTIAGQLEQCNRERRAVELQTFNMSMSFIEKNINLDEERVLVVHGRGWHLGVIGIVASRILECYDRPVIVISEQDDIAKGSARSIAGFSIHDALTACAQHLVAFGGHPFAAGLQLRPENVPAFRKAINEYAGGLLKDNDFAPQLTIDTEVQSHELGFPLIEQLSLLEPYGNANPAPIFSATGMKLADAPRVVGTNHLKLSLYRNGQYLNAIGFNLGCMAPELSANRHACLDVAFVPTVNTFLAQKKVEMDIKDLKIR